jgi:hypothetical protein
MTAEVHSIVVPPEWESKNDWDSHLPLLYVALEEVKKVNGAVSEIGVGMGSTIPIANFCHEAGMIHLAYESNPEWFDKLRSEICGNRDVCSNTMMVLGKYERVFRSWLTFVDCAPAEIRKEIIERSANDSKIILVHDSEESSNYVYGMKDILNTFKYRLDYKPEGKPHTTCVSNFINVTEWA